MKTIYYVLFFCLMSFTAQAQSDSTVSLTVEFDVTENEEGSIRLALYDSAENYLKTPFKSVSSSIEDHTAILFIENIPKGVYSFAYYHDVNNNDKLDRNMMEIPKEPYGFSNDEKGYYGPPSFKDCQIEITANTVLKITIK